MNSLSTPLVGFGQDSHVFVDSTLAKTQFTDEVKSSTTISSVHSCIKKSLVLGGVVIDDCSPLQGNSDADVVLHALCNAISSITGEPFLGKQADAMCKAGITDSAEYVRQQLVQTQLQILHIAVSIEAKRPRLLNYIPAMRQRVADITGIRIDQVGITATSGEELSSYGRGEGIFASVMITASKKPKESPLLVLTTVPTKKLAKELAHVLVTKNVAACVQRLPMESTFYWQGKVCEDNEYVLLIKTTDTAYGALQNEIVSMHPYATVQVIAIDIAYGLPAYMQWIVHNTHGMHSDESKK